MVVSPTDIVSVVPEFGIFDLPFAFRDRAEVKKAVEGPLGRELARLAERKNLVVLGYWENGFRHITNNVRPIRTPDDLAGLKIRAPQNIERLKMFRAWGALAAPLDFSQLLGALNAGVFDGEENPLAQITSAKLYTAQKYLSFSGHVYTPSYLIASTPWWDTLAPEMQRELRSAAASIGDDSRQRGEQLDRQGAQLVGEFGMQINDDVDKNALREASTQLYLDFSNQFGPTLVDLLKSATTGG
jgi:TRAP-type transport system periplasmic protein